MYNILKRHLIRTGYSTIKRCIIMKNAITANQLKTKGVSILDTATSEAGEAVITVRGKDKYVVLTIDEYNRLRECELDAAIQEAQRDIAEHYCPTINPLVATVYQTSSLTICNQNL
jgi:prevent-host-death family protein